MKFRNSGGDDATFRLFEDIYDDYLRRLNETWDATNKRILEAQQKFGQAATAEAAQREYADAVRAAWDESQQAYTAAYEGYVRGFRDAWGKSDVADLTPATVSHVTQRAGAAAGYATSTIGNWQLISWAGVPPWALGSDAGK